MTSEFRYKGVDVVFLKHAGFMIRGSKTVYVDPYDIPQDAELEKADFIFVTHDHFDHLDFRAIRKLSKDNTTVVIPEGCSVEGHATCLLKTGDVEDLDGVKVKSVPAYNIDKEFHPKGGSMSGYIVEMDGVKVYHAGDTDLIPEMKDIEVDIALVPVGGKYTMDVNEAMECINTINAVNVIPMHYGALSDTQADLSKLKSDKVVVLSPMFK